MGRTVSCGDCVHLNYLSGVLRCSEYDFLVWPELITQGIECPQYQSIFGLRNFKTFTGYSATDNNRETVEELVLEALISLCVQRGRAVSVRELTKFINRSSKSSLGKILDRIALQGKVYSRKYLVLYPKSPRRKYWIQYMYAPTLLKGRGIIDESENLEVIDISKSYYGRGDSKGSTQGATEEEKAGTSKP